MTASRFAAAAAGTLLIALLGSPSVADVISEWVTAVVPPAPELKEVTVDPSTTALLFLDIMKAGCSARPRCVAAVPSMKRLHDEARAWRLRRRRVTRRFGRRREVALGAVLAERLGGLSSAGHAPSLPHGCRARYCAGPKCPGHGSRKRPRHSDPCCHASGSSTSNSSACDTLNCA